MKNPDTKTVTFEQVDGILRKVKLNKNQERAIGIGPVITDGIYLFEIIYEKIREGYTQVFLMRFLMLIPLGHISHPAQLVFISFIALPSLRWPLCTHSSFKGGQRSYEGWERSARLITGGVPQPYIALWIMSPTLHKSELTSLLNIYNIQRMNDV
ncbi:MAG: hypothetical protein EZS28_015368 [Streblomastix strix]|uniref:Uncharacterized protein n=1 Tax=Streblomastix strix TaxID=222440 RepID=A0A5J4W296_9EUKA|nr:MAG: hypothetical protein EZS28_015368 [Streblomastix strix]